MIRNTLLGLLFCGLSGVGVASAADVTTIAGSGTSGFRDGPALSASFIAPVAIALAKDGSMYILDRGAQRVRVLRDGLVKTIAGSGEQAAPGGVVRGGFENGPAFRARFNNPSALAVSDDGDVYVADTMNHCVRRIRNGQVTTYAGQPQISGAADGPAAQATFKYPDSLAWDAAGDLYVGDYGVGVRKIAHDSGLVTTLALPSNFKADISSVAVVGRHAELILAVNRDGILHFEGGSRKSTFYRAGPYGPREDGFSDHVFMDGYRTLGYPFSLAPLGTLDFAYTDIWTNSVRVIHGNYTAAVAGGDTENATYTAGGYRNGPLAQARFNAPMGIAVQPDGSFVIADSGNRRIRLVPPTSVEQAAGAQDLANTPDAYRIALVGNSYVLYNASWDDSIAGQVQRQLQARWKALGIPHKPTVFAIKHIAGTSDIGSYIQDYLASGIAEAVVWPFNAANVLTGSGKPVGTDLASDPSWWLPQTQSIVGKTASALSESKAYFLPVLLPMPYEISPTESSWYRLFDLRAPGASANPESQNYEPEHRLLLKALESARRPMLDLWPSMLSEELLPSHAALYGTRDFHLSSAGNAFVADAIVKQLVHDHPWRP